MSAAKPEQERRQYTPEEQELWVRLNMPQKFAVNSLSQYGYSIVFIRYPKINESLVILQSNEQYATINTEGDVDIAPNIKIRE